MAAPLTALQVREFLQDYPEQNLLIDGVEFGDTQIELCMQMAVDEFNLIPPVAMLTRLDIFPSTGILLYGTCWMLFQGRTALAARNNLSYSDGGLQIPVEEKYELYSQLAANFRDLFRDSAQRYKTSANMEAGWGSVHTDESSFPLW